MVERMCWASSLALEPAPGVTAFSTAFSALYLHGRHPRSRRVSRASTCLGARGRSQCSRVPSSCIAGSAHARTAGSAPGTPRPSPPLGGARISCLQPGASTLELRAQGTMSMAVTAQPRTRRMPAGAGQVRCEAFRRRGVALRAQRVRRSWRPHRKGPKPRVCLERHKRVTREQPSWCRCMPPGAGMKMAENKRESARAESDGSPRAQDRT